MHKQVECMFTNVFGSNFLMIIIPTWLVQNSFLTTLEFQIENMAQKILNGWKGALELAFFKKKISLQNARYKLPLGLSITAVTLAQKLVPFLSYIKCFQAVSSIWNVRVEESKFQKKLVCALSWQAHQP